MMVLAEKRLQKKDMIDFVAFKISILNLFDNIIHAYLFTKCRNLTVRG